MPIRSPRHQPRSRWLLPLLVALGCNTPRSSIPTPHTRAAAPSSPTTDAEELRAFAKLYGYVRFFHPSDEAAAADWERVAIEGSRRVVEGTTRAELVVALRETFEPLAPSLLVYPEDQPPPPAEPPRDGPLIAWQHLGFAGEMRSAYDSTRTGRSRAVYAEGSGWASVTGTIGAAPVRGKRLRLRGIARVGGKTHDEQAQLWLRIDGAEIGSEFFGNMDDRPIVATEWTAATIETPVIGPAAKNVAFGGIAMGTGSVWFDDFSLEVAEPGSERWTAVAIPNPGFEAGPEPDGWSTKAPDFTHTVVAGVHDGGAALEITRSSTESSAELFPERPKLGETFTRPLGAGLACRVVLGLPASEPAAPGPVARRETPPGAEDPAVRAAAIVVAWNVLRHFYPYHDVIGEDWDAVLDDAIADVLDDEGPADLALTLRRLVHRLHDGHGRVSGPGVESGGVPLRLAHVEGRHVVLAAPDGLGVVRGDELLRVDGVAIDELLAQRRQLHSGSPQWIDHILLAMGRVTEGPTGSTATLELRRDGQLRTLELPRVEAMPPAEPKRPPIDVLDGGVFYVDLDRAPTEEIMARMAEIAAAPGVVFDLRGYPKGGPSWLPHLLSKPDTAKWMFVAHVIRPDLEGETMFTEYGWDVQPAEPHIAGKVAFITGPGAISYAESVMGYVEGYELGAIVGAPTAGANGNIDPFSVPGGYRIVFTGMKVTRMDGRQHHLVGIQPTHPVERTLAGILAGRDEELEAALAIVRGASP